MTEANDTSKTTKPPLITVLIGENMWIDAVLFDDKHHVIANYIQKDAFRVGNTGLTYRQINHLDSIGLLGSGREDKVNGWRVFKFRDIVYLNTISALKKFGISNELLRGVHDLFYASERVMDEVILICLAAKVEMTLIIRDDGSGHVFNPAFLSSYEKCRGKLFVGDKERKAEMRVVLNDMVNDALKAKGVPECEIKHSVAQMASDTFINGKPSEIEQKILETIRDASYEQIRLKKKGGKPSVLYASSEAKSDMTEEQLLADITKLNYSDVEIKKRDGKVVHYKQEKTIKL